MGSTAGAHTRADLGVRVCAAAHAAHAHNRQLAACKQGGEGGAAEGGLQACGLTGSAAENERCRSA